MLDELLLRLEAANSLGSSTIPDLYGEYEIVPVNEGTIDTIAARIGLRINSIGIGNVAIIHRRAEYSQFHRVIDFSGDFNALIIEDKCQFQGHIIFGNRNICVLMGYQHALNLYITMYNNSVILWGRGSSTFGARIWTHGEKNIVIGDGCLFSEGISIRTSDHHSIIDLKTFEQINHPGDVTLGRRVWINPNCVIMPGVSIGDGSIVGTGSIVNKSIPGTELWAGTPARMVRQNVSWIGSDPATKSEIEELRRFFSKSTAI
jgi:acetyltransferase-like isoleucine patch superfamily enzyme